MELDLDFQNTNIKIIERTKASLSRSFKITRDKDITKAIELANYLFCLGKYKEAKLLLKSFVYFEYDEPQGHLWESNSFGILILASIAEVENELEKQRENAEFVLKAHPTSVEDFEELMEYYQEDLEYHPSNIERAKDETHKYRCEIFGQEALTFLYFHHLAPLFEESPSQINYNQMRKKVSSIVNESYNLLKNELTGTNHEF